MRLVDIGGALKDHMWAVEGNPFPLVEVAEPPTLPHLPYLVYAQTVFMPVQASTYLETAAHMDPARIKINELALERLFTEAIVLKIPLGADAHVTSALIQDALREAGQVLHPGDSLLIGTGWGRRKTGPFCPMGARSAMEKSMAAAPKTTKRGSWPRPMRWSASAASGCA